jgi:hypothetical protein
MIIAPIAQNVSFYTFSSHIFDWIDFMHPHKTTISRGRREREVGAKVDRSKIEGVQTRKSSHDHPIMGQRK